MTNEEQPKKSTMVMSSKTGRNLFNSTSKFFSIKRNRSIVFFAFFAVVAFVLVLQGSHSVDPFNAAQGVIDSGGKYSDAQLILDNAIKNTGVKEKKVNLYLNKSTIALDSGKIVDAIKYSKTADSIYPTSISASMLGLEYSIQNNKAEAVKWYKICITRLDKKSSGYQNDLNDIQVRISRLSQL